MEGRRVAKKRPAECYGPPLTWPKLPSAGHDWEGSDIAHRYRIMCEIGKGVSGHVYEARDRESHEGVAIKICKAKFTPFAVQGVDAMEIHRLHLAQGPNVVRLLDAWSNPCMFAMVMERLEVSLKSWVKEVKPAQLEAEVSDALNASFFKLTYVRTYFRCILRTFIISFGCREGGEGEGRGGYVYKSRERPTYVRT
jgi:serine/threonine protein kinase